MSLQPFLLSLTIALITAPSLGDTPSRPQTGRLHLTFTERSPLSSDEELHRRDSLDRRRWPDGRTWLKKDPADYDLAEVPFEVYVPPKYKPNIPHGLFVWMGVTEFPAAWCEILARHKFIFVASNKNAEVIDAVDNLKKLYTIDDDRVYIAGFSDGARHAASQLRFYPDVFHGALFLMGGNEFYETYQPNPKTPPALTVETPGTEWQGPLDPIKKDIRIVLTRGERDTFTPAEGQLQLEGLTLDGFERASLIIFPNIAHQHPTSPDFEKSLAALDQTKSNTPPTTAPTQDLRPNAAQIAQAQRLLNTAQFWHDSKWPGNPSPAETRRYLQQILDDYPTTPSASLAREGLKKLDNPSTTQPQKRRSTTAR